jgi:hypothetical protein
MLVRCIKLFVQAVAGLLLAFVAAVGIYIVSDRIEFSRVNITDALVRDGRYDPAEHFVFDRACTTSAGSSGEPAIRVEGYTETDWVDREPTIFWHLVLINDGEKTYRNLYVYDPVVESPGTLCNATITLRTEKVDGRLRAYVEEERGH